MLDDAIPHSCPCILGLLLLVPGYIRPRAETLAGPGDNQGAAVVVHVDGVQYVSQLQAHVVSDGVELIGTVQGEDEIAVVLVQKEVLEGHSDLPVLWAGIILAPLRMIPSAPFRRQQTGAGPIIKPLSEGCP